MKENYDNLCIFNFGKRCYVVMKNNYKVVYFESINGKYVMPITSFNLYDNEGKSLTVVNQHFFMNQLINRINIALDKGYFNGDKEVVDYLSDLKNSVENDVSLKNLFKGSLMGQIDVDNFEINKREILKYLDKFRIDSFTPYNNVSIFNGSLEKESSDNVSVGLKPLENSESLNLEEIVESDPVNDFSLNIVFNGITGLNKEVEIDNLSEEVVSNSSNNGFDFADINKYEVVDDNEAINSNDYFSNLSSNNSEQMQERNTDDVSGNKIQSDDVLESNSIFNDEFGIQDNNVFSNDEVNSVIENSVDNQTVEYKSILDSIGSVSEENISNVSENVIPEINISNSNNSVSNNLENSSIVNSESLNSSYIDQVKNRIQNSNVSLGAINNVNQVNYGNEISNSSSFEPNINVDLNKEVISDKNELPELENISNTEVSVSNDKKGKGSSIVVILIILLLLGFVSYCLYNYVF